MVVRGRVVEEGKIKKLSSQDIPVAVVRRARIHATELFRVTPTVVVSTARGLGTPGVLARDAACRNKPERCVLHETQAVEEQCVPLFEAKLKTATLACKLHISCLLACPRRFYFKHYAHSPVLVGGSFLHSLLYFPRTKLINRVDNDELLEGVFSTQMH